ncbi:hypothetical protein H2248_008417 [Termitomyces sp. 'cryptogamus']|nr:hypothetical protein H2248_008417 [Termitomyces sp. 'cryptogamus']
MSFEHTPINDIRRLPHSQFLKPPSQKDPKPLPTTAAIYGHPAPLSPVRNAAPDDDAPALTRFYRKKQEQAASRPGAPKTTTSPLRPDRWDLPDTTVNIAGAFASAMNTANQSWGSTASQPPSRQVGRGTSVEYEDGAANASRRLQISKPGSSSRTRKPLSKNGSLTVPDSEGEEERPSRSEREKSPFMEIVDTAKSAFGTATFFAKQRIMELGEPPRERERESSYDYEKEQREYENQSMRRAKPPSTKRNRMSEDNRAYLPDQSDLESDEDYESDGKTKRRKKKKKEPAGSMNNLPVIAPEKRRKKKPKDRKGVTGEAEDEASESDDASAEQISTRQRGSLRPDIARHPSLPRQILPPDDYAPDTSMDIEQGLVSIPEEEDLAQERPRGRERERERQSSQRRSVSRQRSSRIGGPLGQLVNFIFRKLFALVFIVWQLFTSVLYLSGGLTANIYDVLFRRPLSWIAFAGAAPFLKMIAIGLVLSGLYSLRQPLLHYLPVPHLGGPSQPVFQAPEIPAANIAELAARLQVIETALAGLSFEAEKGRLRAESDGRTQLELAGRLGALENKVGVESRKAVEVETRVKEATRDTFGVVRQEIEVLQAQIQAVQQRPPSPSSGHGHGHGPANDEEARARVRALEERVGSVEGGVKEALELGKKVISVPSDVEAGAAWWNKLASGSAAKSGLTIKSSDGQDVTSLIEHLVDTAVSTYSKDTIARADYALHSGGARIIPSLTSPTFEVKPKTLRGSILSMITGGAGHAIGRPPVWALHHELHNGHCWPVAGQSGQLGVALAAPIYIDEVSIDHVAEEVAFDMRSAPREMELWGLVEGTDNVEKVLRWKEERRRRREEARENGEEVEEEPEVPSTLPRAPMYVRVAEFAYDIHAPRNVQTFPVDPELRALGVDFGVVVLMMKSNWGREYTCLYRLRVHGQRIDQVPPVVGEEEKV